VATEVNVIKTPATPMIMEIDFLVVVSSEVNFFARSPITVSENVTQGISDPKIKNIAPTIDIRTNLSFSFLEIIIWDL